ncbi:hypothetical protein ACFYUY_21165 [Kitasatospora sp. NPDC004745]|uniref:hypothetical protein n=1 Tax=unclassified Kitasatospora TaxID=2633591 RepID=UPI0033E4BB6A
MPYASFAAPGTALAATGVAAGQIWPVVIATALVLSSIAAVRLSFRRGRGPLHK